jgi:hypothetical protein
MSPTCTRKSSAAPGAPRHLLVGEKQAAQRAQSSSLNAFAPRKRGCWRALASLKSFKPGAGQFHQSLAIFANAMLHKSEVDGVFPNRQSRTAGPPSRHNFPIGSRPNRDPFQQIED